LLTLEKDQRFTAPVKVRRSERHLMGDSWQFWVTRRSVLAALALASVHRSANAESGASSDGDSIFSPTGPNADLFGQGEGYPIKDPRLWHQPGAPLVPKYRVGAFSHGDEIFASRKIPGASSPWLFKRHQVDIQYFYRGRASTVVEYMSRHPVTGLLIIKDDKIIFERYQYGRTDRDRFFSGSIVKSIIGMLVGIAVAEGAINSVDDTPDRYVPGFKGSEYGKTPIRDLLHMASGVEFREGEDGGRDLNRLWIDMVRGSSKGTIGSIVQFDRRVAPAGTRWFYASIEPDVLGVTLRYATNSTASDYLHQKVWTQIGAESDASWMIDAQGFEVAHTHFNAVLRDYGRLGRLLAHDGAWEGRQIIPLQWMMDATKARESDAYLAPGRSGPQSFGYGYLFWLLPGSRRQFALWSDFGNRILVDPISKLVLVQTAVESTQDEVMLLWSALVEQFSER
jgi:CubicO group peptidase (beta-lactamase class C family)